MGASLRFIISKYVSKLLDIIFPFGTLVVNVLGGTLIGFIMVLCIKSNMISDNMKLFLTAGFLGGLTTFSTFSLETVTFFEVGNALFGLINIFLNLGLSILGVVIGKTIANVIIK